MKLKRPVDQLSYIKQSELFDAEWYRKHYGLEQGADPAAHYLTQGWKQGFDPSPRFSTKEYLYANPDVRQAQVNPLFHYEHCGRGEGRQIVDRVVKLVRASAYFDEPWYRETYGLKDQDDAVHHYLEHWKQNPYLDPSLDFSTSKYLVRNQDVADAEMNPLQHYVLYGRREKRTVFQSILRSMEQSPFFDREWYAREYGVEPARAAYHYVSQGAEAGNQPSPEFPDQALLDYDDVRSVMAEEDCLGEIKWYDKLNPLYRFFLLNDLDQKHVFYSNLDRLTAHISSHPLQNLSEGKGGENLDIKIFIPCNKDSYIPDNPLFQPIQTGCASSGTYFEGCLHDDQGENISDRNFTYCELTAQYWAWKNSDADYFGFFHNRRMFSFSAEHFRVNGEQLIPMNGLNAAALERLGLTEQNMRAVISQYDILVPEAVDVKDFSCFDCTPSIRHQFCTMNGMAPQDFELAMDIVVRQHPEYADTIRAYMDENTYGYFRLMYIMKKELFHRYCEWLFPILDEFYQQMDFTNYGIYEIRSLGMVAERLFGLWFTHQKLHEHYRYKELQCAFFSSIQDENLAPAFPENNVALVLPCNGFHAPLTAVTLQSIVEHSSERHNYDVIIAERYVPDQYREQLRQIVGARPNFSLRFLSLGDGLDNHFTGDNQDLLDYYKLVIPDILKQYDRVLCLDPSMLAQSDVAELFAQDMGGKPLAAAQDVTVQGMLRMVDTQNTRRYLSQVLCLKDIFQYVNTSVLLMDLAQLRKLHRWNELQRIAEAEHWIWAEQDVINYLYQGQIQFLDQDWNCIASQSINEISMIEYYAPKELYQAYRKALKQPKLLRFHHPMSHLSFYNEIFWATARKTPYYESLVRFA